MPSRPAFSREGLVGGSEIVATKRGPALYKFSNIKKARTRPSTYAPPPAIKLCAIEAAHPQSTVFSLPST